MGNGFINYFILLGQGIYVLIMGRLRLFISLFLAIVITFGLYSIYPSSLEIPVKYHNVSSNGYVTYVTYSGSIEPSYFDSVGKVYAVGYSPYANFLKELRLEVSVDKDYWADVPIYSTPPNRKNLTMFADLGYVNLNQVKINFYGKTSFTQQIELPGSISKEEFLNSLKVSIEIEKINSPKDWVLLFLVFIATLGSAYGILNSILPNEDKYKR